MVFSSSVMATVAKFSTDKWQRMRRVPSSELMNTQQLMEVACCLPLSHLFICLWEFLCFSVSDYDSDDDYDYVDDDDDDVDDDDVVAFDHNSNGDFDDHGSSSLDFDDYYHYSDSD
ncbi:hypothetical protein ISN44_As03g013600 [Arabidopsis suecica]|uniref:Uncharacterized protein n=1 Tax=Arabidopsis suecica TaxID=45249 RepID=A0A8T2FAQ4_ARASU|nr:hypothetical protein ISN44_As03g013600 [Arabidopsis suecica]